MGEDWRKKIEDDLMEEQRRKAEEQDTRDLVAMAHDDFTKTPNNLQRRQSRNEGDAENHGGHQHKNPVVTNECALCKRALVL